MFFVLGRGRSGSTLLIRMLDAHPRVAVAEESLFIMSLARRYRDGGWDERRVRRFARDIWRERRMARWRLDPASLEARLVDVLPMAGFARLCAEVYAARAAARGRPDASLLGDKNPHYALFAGDLARLFPRARFLFLTRDYRDNVASYRGVRFDLKSAAGLAYRWRAYNQSIRRAELAYPERFMRVRYEDLVQSPPVQLARICEFLGIEFEPAMLDYAQLKRDAELPWHGNLGGAPDAQRHGRWRTELSLQDAARIEAICQPFASSLGYEPSPGAARSSAIGRAAGEAWGWLVTAAERFLFRLPLELRSGIIDRYRRATGNPI